MSESGGSALWKAIDEILARPVAIRTFETDFARAGDVVTAARAASRLTDPRLTQVFDADDSGERAYVVSEWVVGDNLDDLLQQGPMEPERAAALLCEAAEAIATAHRAGLAHLRLAPRNLIWTTGGTVKVTGLAVEAALAGASTAAAGEVDARGLGRLLYAAATAYWPADESAPPTASRLPAAPIDGGIVCAPGQVLAGVPHALDAVVCQALGVRIRGGRQPFTTPGEVADALGRLPRTPLPLFMGMRGGPPPAVPAPPPRTASRPTPPVTAEHATPAPPIPPVRRVGSPPAAQSHRHRSTGGGQVNKPLVGLAALLAVVVVAVGGWQLSHLGGGGGASQSPSASAPGTTQGSELRVAGASGFDPPPGDGDEKSDRAHLAVDSKQGTAWTTEAYNSDRFGRLKSGVGLLLDMGKTVRVSDVKVTLPGATGSVLQLRVGDSANLGSLRLAAKSTNTDGTITFHPSSAPRGRYVLLWFTRLAPDGGRYRGEISDVVIRGAAS
ncbi:MAG TPA: protein kinase family protein [Streptosporangiaceae bacterium]